MNPRNSLIEAQQDEGSVAIGVPVDAVDPECDVQIATAKRFPRSLQAFKNQALEMATLDEETAAGCFYSMPRGGKPVEGPSVRLAEIVMSAWGNLRADAKVVSVNAREICASALCWDLEKNVAVRVEIRRRITDRNGNRYGDDMIVVTGNAACAIALRNAVFKVIPNVYTRSIYQAARQTAIGNAETLSKRRAEMVAYFGKMGVKPEQVFAVVNRASVEEITLDDLAALKGLATAIKDGDTTVDDAFTIRHEAGGDSFRPGRHSMKPAPAESARPETPATAPTDAEGKVKNPPPPAKGKGGKLFA